MPATVRTLAALALTVALASPTTGQTGQHPLAVIRYRGDGSAGKLVSIPVSVNGAAPRWFCVDTGAPRSAIDPRLADQLGLVSKASSPISGTGRGSVTVGHPGAQTLRIGALSLAVADPMILDLKGVPINAEDRGLVGSELFEAYVVRIDSRQRTLAIIDPRRFHPGPRQTAIPLSTDGSRLYIDATLDVRPGVKVVHRLRIDTGSEDSVNDPIVKQARTVHSTELGHGLGANYQGVSGIYDAVEIGPYRIKHVWGPGGDLPAIGMELLRRFVVTFDVPHRRLYLEPTQALRDPVPSPSASP